MPTCLPELITPITPRTNYIRVTFLDYARISFSTYSTRTLSPAVATIYTFASVLGRALAIVSPCRVVCHFNKCREVTEELIIVLASAPKAILAYRHTISDRAYRSLSAERNFLGLACATSDWHPTQLKSRLSLVGLKSTTQLGFFRFLSYIA